MGEEKRISFDDFEKIDLRVGKIIEAEKIEKSEKLVKLQVDLNQEKRQIVAGIGKVYDIDDFIGKEIVIVVNLESRLLMGVESRGMLLTASSNEGPILLVPEKEVEAGSKIS